MTWFKVDDGFAFHPKTMQASLPAIALWTIAGSWSARNLTDGFIPRHALTMLARGETYLADELVDCQLWVKPDDGRDGWLFHDWHQFNHSRDQVETKRTEDAQRKADWRRRRTLEREAQRKKERAELDRLEDESRCDSARTDNVTDGVTPEGVPDGVTGDVPDARPVPYPTRPDPVPDSLRESELPLVYDEGGAGGEPASPEPEPEPEPEPPKRPMPKPNRGDQGHRIPDDWEPTDGDMTWLRNTYPELLSRVTELTDEFKDYWESTPGARARKTNWSKTWKNRMRDRAGLVSRNDSGRNGLRSVPSERGRSTTDQRWDDNVGRIESYLGGQRQLPGGTA